MFLSMTIHFIIVIVHLESPLLPLFLATQPKEADVYAFPLPPYQNSLLVYCVGSTSNP